MIDILVAFLIVGFVVLWINRACKEELDGDFN